LSRTAPLARLRASSTRYGAAAFGGLRSLTRSSTRTIRIQAIKAATDQCDCIARHALA
jgi:hypothetical protein